MSINCTHDVQAYGECVRHFVAPDASRNNNECLTLYDTELIQHIPFHHNNEAVQILTKGLPEDIINKVVPKCLIVIPGSLEATILCKLNIQYYANTLLYNADLQ